MLSEDDTHITHIFSASVNGKGYTKVLETAILQCRAQRK